MTGEELWTGDINDHRFHIIDLSEDGENLIVIDCTERRYLVLAIEESNEEPGSRHYRCPCGEGRCLHLDAMAAYYRDVIEEPWEVW